MFSQSVNGSEGRYAPTVPAVSTLFKGLWGCGVENQHAGNEAAKTSQEETANAVQKELTQEPSARWLLSTFADLEAHLVAGTQMRSEDDLKKIVSGCKEYFGDVRTCAFLVKAIKSCQNNEIKEVTRRATYIYNTSSTEVLATSSREARVALLRVQMYACRCLIECAAAHAKKQTPSETIRAKSSAFFVRAFGATMQTASRLADEKENALSAQTIDICIDALKSLHQNAPDSAKSLQFSDCRSDAPANANANAAEAITNGVCLCLSFKYKAMAEATLGREEQNRLLFLVRRVLFEDRSPNMAGSINGQMRRALAHYFWQFATAMYNASRYADATDFLHLLLRPELQFLSPKPDAAIEQQGDATDVNVLTLLAELYAHERNVAEASALLDDLEARLRQQHRWPPTPTTHLKISYTRLRCHLIDAGAGVGGGITSERDAGRASECLQSMIKYGSKTYPRALTNPNTVGFKVLLASCRELLQAVGVNTPNALQNTFEHMKAACAAASEGDVSRCMHDINVTMLAAVAPIIATTWEEMHSKSAEATVWGALRDVHEFVISHPTDMPQKSLLVASLWTYASSMRSTASARPNALKVLEILALVCKDDPNVPNVYHNMAEVCIECFDVETTAQDRVYLDRGMGFLRSAWPMLPSFPPTQGALNVLTNLQLDPTVPLRSLYLHLRIIFRYSRIGAGNVEADVLANYARGILAAAKTFAKIDMFDVHNLLREVVASDPTGHRHAPVIAAFLETIIITALDGGIGNAEEIARRTQALLVARFASLNIDEDSLKHARIKIIPNDISIEKMSALYECIRNDVLRLISVPEMDGSDNRACIAWIIQCVQSFSATALSHVVDLGLRISTERHIMVMRFAEMNAAIIRLAKHVGISSIHVCIRAMKYATINCAYILICSSEIVNGLITCPLGDPASHVAELVKFALLCNDVRQPDGTLDDALTSIQLFATACIGDNADVEMLARSVNDVFSRATKFSDWNHALVAQIAYLCPRCDMFGDVSVDVGRALFAVIAQYSSAFCVDIEGACAALNDKSAVSCAYVLWICLLDPELDITRASRLIEASERLLERDGSVVPGYFASIAIFCWNFGASQSDKPQGVLDLCNAAKRLIGKVARRLDGSTVPRRTAAYIEAAHQKMEHHAENGDLRALVASTRSSSAPLAQNVLVGDFISARQILGADAVESDQSTFCTKH